MRIRDPSPRRRARALGDLVLVVAAGVAAYVAASAVDAAEGLHALLLRNEHRELDELIVVLAILSCGFALFAALRWRDLGREIRLRIRAERALREEERRYRSLVEHSPDAILVHSDGRFVFANPAAAELLGADRPDVLLGQPVTRIVHPAFHETVLSRIRREVEHGEVAPLLEERFVRLDGRVIDVEVAGIPITWEGHPAGQIVVRDVTDRKRAEALVREAEARYRTLVEQLPAIVYVQDLMSGTTYVSPQIETILGYPRDAWNGEAYWNAVHPEDRERVRAEDLRTDRTGEPFLIEYRMLHARGHVVWVRDEAVLVRDEAGRPRYWQGVRFDITHRKEAEEQLRAAEERYRTLVEQLPAVLYIDRPHEVDETVYVSPQIEEILGIPAERYLAEPDCWEQHLHPEDRARAVAEYREGVRRGGRFSQEYRIVRPDGRVVWVRDDAVVFPDHAGGPPTVQGVMYDLTELKLAEQALRESERREREAAERLRALDEMKNTFLAAVSHELRSPLTSILGLALTLEQQEGMDPADRRDLLSRLATNARKLDRLLTDLLDIDRLQRGIVTPRYRPTDVGALVGRAVESLEVLADRRVQVRADPVPAIVDPAKVERIVENLLVNAARHTGPDRTVWVEVRAEAGGVLITVEDDGPGVPPALRAEIFEPFRQGPPSSPHRPGTGIGLSLVARFAELHGGRAWVEEREGGGASFRVWLPIGPEQAEAPPGRDDLAARAARSAGAG